MTELAAFREQRARLGAVGGPAIPPAWTLPAGLPAAPPSGTVTFLLTDIEGSTVRWETAPEAMAAAQERHYQILDAAVTAHGGFRPIEQGEGDSLVAAFARASDAAAAALGAQVLVSAATAELLADVLPAPAELVPLGRHRLKALRTPEQVYQLTAPTLPRTFPPIASPDGMSSTVPIPLTSLVGRTSELGALADLITGHRLVSVVGPGGCGKTRLAAQTAGDAVGTFPDGVWWVELADVSDPNQVPTAVLTDIGVDARWMDPLERLISYLAGRRVLLVLDNCEQVAAEVSRLAAAVVRGCPRAHVLATTREPLGVPGETAWRIGPLSLPQDLPPELLGLDAVLSAEAIQLFGDRAAQARAGFRVDAGNAATVASICRRVDGIPLAIELAAAQVRVLSPGAILDGLDDQRPALSARTAPARQQTVTACVQWSHALLTEAQRMLFRRLAVFAGPFDLAAAEAVASGGSLAGGDVLPLLAGLVDKSLVGFDGEHYQLLQTVRDFALTRLAVSDETTGVHRRHLDHYLSVAASGAAELSTAPQVAMLERLEAARSNALAALDWALLQGMHEAAGRLVSDLSLFWQLHGRHFESLANVRRVLRATPQSPSPLRARLLQTAGQLGVFGMDLPGGYGVPDTNAAIEMASALGCDDVLGRALGMRGFVTVFAAPRAALETLSEAHATARRASDRFGLTAAASSAGFAAVFGCDRPDSAAPHLAEFAEQAKASGSPLWKIWHGLSVGIGHWRAGRFTDAISILAAAEDLGWVLGDPVLESWCALFLADAHIDRADYAAAERTIERSASWMDRSSLGRLEFVLSRRVRLELHRGEIATATAALDAVEDFVCSTGFPFLTIELKSLRARLAQEAGDLSAARAALEEASSCAVGLGTPWYLAAVANLEGRLKHAEGKPGAAEDAHHRALALCVEYGFAAVAAETLEQLASVAAAGESWPEAARLYGAAAALREHTGSGRAATDEPAVTADLLATRAALGEDEFEAAYAEGFALSLADAAAYASRARGERKRPSAGWESLTPTELRVVDLVAQGRTNAQIANQLFIAPGTVKVHVHRIFTKLGITRRAELATRATERRLTDIHQAGTR